MWEHATSYAFQQRLAPLWHILTSCADASLHLSCLLVLYAANYSNLTRTSPENSGKERKEKMRQSELDQSCSHAQKVKHLVFRSLTNTFDCVRKESNKRAKKKKTRRNLASSN